MTMFLQNENDDSVDMDELQEQDSAIDDDAEKEPDSELGEDDEIEEVEPSDEETGEVE